MKHLAAHYMNKYPSSVVMFDEKKLDVLGDGGLKIALRTNGNGMIVDSGDECGASDKHDIGPIPKDARVYKLYADGSLKKSEEANVRVAASKSLAVDGKILSIEEYKKLGYKFNDKGEIIGLPVKAEVAPIAPEQL